MLIEWPRLANSRKPLPPSATVCRPSGKPHEATWIAWPHNRTDWPGRFEPIPWVYAEIVRHLARVERVNILVEDEAAEAKVRELLIRAHVLPEKAAAPGKPAGTIRFHHIPTNRGWTRDSGPIFLRRDSRATRDFPAVAATAWRFNAWAKYNDWKLDATIAGEIVDRLRVPVWEPEVRVNGHPRPVVLEGGSIDVNGCGTLITTEECLLSEVQQRNPGVTREQLEEIFADYLGVEKGNLAGSRHRRRRHSWARRRHHSLRHADDRGDGLRA